MSKKGADHKKQLSRVNRIEGQVRGIGKMIEEEKYCIDILTQIKAVRSAMKSLELEMLESHLNCCLKGAVQSESKEQMNEKIEEILTLIKRVSKS
ncbi:MAG: transcriptional regulator [Halobacteriovorax sp.]|nr:transcriptional regulator [Halobacteriovorax sp.]|tara:strand:+ start:133058 stop:133342 length:285 start_codon:yes stop_codon:yes gene_type:complete